VESYTNFEGEGGGKNQDHLNQWKEGLGGTKVGGWIPWDPAREKAANRGGGVQHEKKKKDSGPRKVLSVRPKESGKGRARNVKGSGL